jgi:formylmethanofuran dehydrogenase subunit C
MRVDLPPANTIPPADPILITALLEQRGCYTPAMLALRYNVDTSIPVEVEGLTPSAVRTMSLPEIERFEIYHGNRKRPLAEFFDVAGDPSDGRIEMEGDLHGVHWIGARMSDGEIHVHGDAGRHVGSGMTGGAIHVHGSASDWVGGEMHGGIIHVHGNAGDLVGAAYRGSRVGMSGGTILVHGAAGNEVGLTLRRGMIAVGGRCGDFVGFDMIAGSVLVFGPSGGRPAAGMRRGTVALLGEDPPTPLVSFRQSCIYQPPVLQLMFRSLVSHGFDVPRPCFTAKYALYHGDHATVGRGELLLREPA